MNTRPTPETEKLYKLAIYHLPYDTNNRANYQVWHTVGLLKSHMERFERELAEARGQRDRLAEALREVREMCLDKTIELHPDHDLKGTIDECIDISNDALQSLTPNDQGEAQPPAKKL